MAGRGPAPKPAAIRQRANRKTGAALLDADARVKAPAMPPVKGALGEGWHTLTRVWWKRVWDSPMAGEYLETDADGLGRLAILIDRFYWTCDPGLMAEIRLQEARFGLSPVDRSRLQWEVARGDEATRKRTPKTAAREPDKFEDPRSVLKVVAS